MPSFLADDPTLVYLILATLALGLGAAFWRTRKQKLLLAAGGAVALLGIVALIDALIDTPREKVERSFSRMTASAKRADIPGVFQGMSPSFRFGNMNKDAFQKSCTDAAKHWQVTEVVLWEADIRDIKESAGTAEVEFRAKARGSFGGGYDYYFVRSVWVRDADGEWRMQSFRLFNPVNTKDEIGLPWQGAR